MKIINLNWNLDEEPPPKMQPKNEPANSGISSGIIPNPQIRLQGNSTNQSYHPQNSNQQINNNFPTMSNPVRQMNNISMNQNNMQVRYLTLISIWSVLFFSKHF